MYMVRFILFIVTLGLGAVGYSLLRSGSGPATGGSGSPAGGGAAAETETGRCAATTRGGQRCTRDAEPGSEHCWQHGGG